MMRWSVKGGLVICRGGLVTAEESREEVKRTVKKSIEI